MNYYNVIPLTKLDSQSGTLTYACENQLEIGSFVQIPLRNSAKTALVTEKVDQPSFQTKEILKVLVDEQKLPKHLIELSDFIREKYFCTLGEALSAIVPADVTKKRRLIVEQCEESKKLQSKLELSSAQKEIFEDITADITTKPHLIHGVTGSGKTEIYLQLVEKTLSEGKSAIILIPEISLTPQTSARFIARFGSKVAVTHSDLKETERFQIWKDALLGNVKVVIGPRSALFAPLFDLGLIVIDEAHDSSYKQDQTPRYNALAVAVEIARLTSSKLVLGTATPLVETYYQAENNNYTLHHLHDRIHGGEMPKIEIVDMRNEFKLGNRSIISEKLQSEIKKTLSEKRQVLLFLNRRGMSTFVSCRECGHVENCPHCEVPLVFHYNNMKLECHHCEFKKAAPAKCPECGSMAIKYFGSGTEKIELEVKKLFGDIRVARMDRDTTTVRGSHDQIFEQIKEGWADIIIGTQMIAKGWDLPNIGLIGVISADSMINLPDYMARERAFSTLLQVAGRTGRGTDSGKVFIQTYNPDVSIFAPLKHHSYEEFYKIEVKDRQELGYPPFVKLLKLLYNNPDPEKTKNTAETIANSLSETFAEKNLKVAILGPSPAFIPKLNGKYRYQIVIKLYSAEQIVYSEIKNIITNTLPRDWSIDADPYGLL